MARVISIVMLVFILVPILAPSVGQLIILVGTWRWLFAVLLAASLLYMTQGRPGEMLRASLVDAALCVVAILAGLSWGVTGVAASIAVTGVLVRLPLAFWLATRRGPVSMHDIMTAIAPAICAAVMAGITVWAVRHGALAEEAPTVGSVLLVGLCGLAAIGLAVLAWPETRSELARLSMTVQSKGRALWSS